MLTFVPHKISEDYKIVEFYRVNKDLCENELYKDLKPTSILLYALLCDRLSMSYANENKSNISKNKFHYYDEDENVFVIFTRIDLEKKLHIGKQSLCSAFKELIKANLIKEIRQGKNKPNKIYVGKTISEINNEFVPAHTQPRSHAIPGAPVRAAIWILRRLSVWILLILPIWRLTIRILLILIRACSALLPRL